MKNVLTPRMFVTLSSLLATVAIVGCQHDKIHGEDFAAADAPTSIGSINQAQSAAGAKEDAMLYDMHFHGTALTSLGQGKLDLIVKGTPAGDPVLVYLNTTGDNVADRTSAVTEYLRTEGVSSDKIVIAIGSNTNTNHSTSYQLHRLYKQDGTTYTGQMNDDAGGSAPSMAGH